VRVLADGQTDTHTHTDANRFYNLSHAICYSYGTDKYMYPAIRQYLHIIIIIIIRMLRLTWHKQNSF